MAYKEVNGTKIYFEQQGSGSDIVFISGLGADHTGWDASSFVDQFRVLQFDNRWVGRSGVTATTDTDTMQTFVDDTVQLCNELGIEKAHFVGHSMGGHIAQYIAAQHPDLVDKLVLACSEPDFSSLSYLATKLQVEFREHDLPFKTMIESYLPFLFSIHFLEETDKVEEFVTFVLDMENRQSDEGYVAQVRSIRNHDTKPLLSKITSPTLVIGCQEDLLTPFSRSEYLADHINNAELMVIQNSGHLPQVEQPKALYQMILDFLLR